MILCLTLLNTYLNLFFQKILLKCFSMLLLEDLIYIPLYIFIIFIKYNVRIIHYLYTGLTSTF